MQTTVNLSENAFHQVSNIARITEQTIDEVIEETIENRFEEEVESLTRSVSLSSDKEVLDLANLKMSEDQSARLSHLLGRGGETTLTNEEKEELGSLMQINRLNDLRKSIGIVEALTRGLIHSVDELA